MVKSPRVKHSTTRSEPVTIDLDPKDVARETAADASGPLPEGGMAGDTTAHATPLHQDAPASVEAEMAAVASDTGEKIDEAPKGDRIDEASTAETAETTTSFDHMPPRAAETRSPRSDRLGSLAAGLAGGVAVLMLGSILQWSGLIGGGDDGSLAATELRAEVDRLRDQVAALQSNDGGAQRIDTLAAELEVLRGELGAADDGVDAAALEERLTGLEQAIAAAGQASTAEAALQAIEERLAALEGGAAVAQVEERVSQLEGTLGEVSQQVEAQAGQPDAALIIAASALQAAIDRGQPFMTELETLAALDPEAEQVAALRDMAASGVPTRAQIASELNRAADAMVTAERPVDPNAGIWDRLVSSAQELVVVRPVGVVEGEGVPQIVARLEAAVAAGDYQTAISEYETLPEAAQAAGADFIAMVRARATADQLVEQALASALNQS